MGTETWAGPLGEIRSITTANGGSALSTTAAYITLPKGAHHLFIEGRNYATTTVIQLDFNPYLIVLKTTDALATATDYSENAQDGSTDTSVVLSSLSTAANLDFLYVGSHLPFSGVDVDVDAANGNASIITVNYYPTNGTWSNITATDGTAAAGASLGQDGSVTWTVPTDWCPAKLRNIITTCAVGIPYSTDELYWTRWQWSATLDSSTTLDHMLAINRSTAHAELVSGRVLEMRVKARQVGGMGNICGVVAAGTANVIINAASAHGGGFV